MTPQQQQEQAFAEAYKKLCAQFGLQIIAVLQPRQFGQMVQVEAALTVEAIPNWQPPAPDTTDGGSK